MAEEWVMVEHQHRPSFQPKHVLPAADAPSSYLVSDYFEPNFAETNPFRPAPARSKSLAFDGVHVVSPIVTLRENIVQIMAHLRETNECSCPPEIRCTCARESAQFIQQKLSEMADIVENNHLLMDALCFDNQPTQTQTVISELASSVMLVPESEKYAAPANLDAFLHPEHISRLQALVSSATATASQGRDKLSSKSFDVVKALPSSQSLQVIAGVLVLYYALPNVLGMGVAGRVLNLLFVNNVVLANTYDVVSTWFNEIGESSGHRVCVVPL
eukprot:c39482_g1_i1.p1 GENE.c39482_g1_i1~~c39482_g1_i1.p1  ORF type:complete len:288 (+),score=53.97 c39482_g1_i1:46-864(+)